MCYREYAGIDGRMFAKAVVTPRDLFAPIIYGHTNLTAGFGQHLK